MKQLIAVLLTVFGLMFASSALAEAYTVRSGDTLCKIANGYQGVSYMDIFRANSQILKSPDKIYPGQKLEIPSVETKTLIIQIAYQSKLIAIKARRKKKRLFPSSDFKWPDNLKFYPVYYYAHVDRAPVGRSTNPAPYIDKMLIPTTVKKQFQSWAKSKNSDWKLGHIGKDRDFGLGDSKLFSHLFSMGYGKNGKVLRKVAVVFNILRKAKYWQMNYEGIRYYLICDQICYNWSYFTESIPVQPVQSAKPKKVVMPKTSVKSSSFKSRIKYRSMDPEVEAWLYAGTSKGVHNNVGDHGSYYGGNISVFLDKWKMGDGYFRIGPAYQYVGWDGTAGDVDYDGSFNLFGAEAQYLTATTKDQLKVLFGPKTGYVYGNGFPYYAKETADLIALEGAHQWWNPAENYEWEVGFRAEIATGNDKYSTWEGRPISRDEDPALNQSMYSIRAKRTWTKHKNFMPTLEGSANYRASNDAVAVQIRSGVKLWDETIEPSLSYEHQFVDGDTTGAVGANINIDLSRLSKKVFNWLRSSG